MVSLTVVELDQLRTFLAVLVHGSFSRAASAMRASQSTVSFHVKALETAVGARLLDRGGGRVSPTAAGKVLKRYAERIVALRDEAASQVGLEESGEVGSITIAASTVPAERLIPRAIAQFRAHHPGVSIDVEVSDSERAVAALVAQTCDLAVVGARVRNARVVYTAVADDEVVLVAPGDAPAKTIGKLPMIVREEGSGTLQAVAALLPEARVCVRIGSAEGVRRCVIEGVGVAFLSRRTIDQDLASGAVKVVPLEGTPVRRRFFAARLKTVALRVPVKAFIAALRTNET